MKTEQLPFVERYNHETGEFEDVVNISDEKMAEIMGVFNAEEKIIGKDVETRSWMENVRGVLHIEYD